MAPAFACFVAPPANTAPTAPGAAPPAPASRRDRITRPLTGPHRFPVTLLTTRAAEPHARDPPVMWWVARMPLTNRYDLGSVHSRSLQVLRAKQLTGRHVSRETSRPLREGAGLELRLLCARKRTTSVYDGCGVRLLIGGAPIPARRSPPSRTRVCRRSAG